MAPRERAADDNEVRRPLLAVLVGALAVATLVGASTTATAGRACGNAAGDDGYGYAGHQASYRGHGVRATIMLTRGPSVASGHVAGWVGVGGPGQGANGEDAWIQAGIASMPGMDPFVYAELTREGRDPEFILIEQGVPVGRSHRIAVLEMSGRAGWWRVWVDGNAVTEPCGCASRQVAGRRSLPPRPGTAARQRAIASGSGSSVCRSRTGEAAPGGRSFPTTSSSMAGTSFRISRRRLRKPVLTAGASRATESCRMRSSRTPADSAPLEHQPMRGTFTTFTKLSS